MIGIFCIGVVTALAVVAILVKKCAAGPKKAEKWEKAEIMKQLLALAERENGTSAAAPSRSRTPPSQRMRPGGLPRKPAGKASQPIGSNNGGC
jgi:hypothetical protein